MLGKEIIGGLAVLFNLGSSGFYLWQVFRRGIKPHAFSWFIWGVLSLISFAAQYVSDAGAGSWVIGASGASCLFVAVIGLFRGEKNITRKDWACLAFSLLAIPAWVITSNPLWAVIIVSIIDAIAFYPTMRKSWVNPREESVTVFSIFALQMSLSLIALENYTLTTALYPAVIVVMNVVLVFMLLCRRKALA